MAAVNYMGAWHVRPTPAEFDGRPGIKNTWTGPIQPELYGGGLKSLCERTQDNLMRLSCEMQKVDPCLEYGIKHWHPTARPKSANNRVSKRPASSGKWENLDVMFADNSALDSLSMNQDDEADSYMDPPQPGNKFCYFCSTMEEHQRHMLHHRPKKRPASAKPRVTYIAPTPKQKKKVEEEEKQVKERLYKVEVYTSDLPNAGTSANVFISIKGSVDVLTRSQLKKNRGCSKLCFVRASKEVFHIKGPFLGNLQILTIEHDGKTRSHGWHLDRVEVTDVKALKTWLFACSSWLSMYEKPHYSHKLDLKAHEKEKLPTVYSIEVYTGKAKMAGTDAKIYLTLFGDHGQSKKVHLADTSSDKKLFERKSVDKFKIQMNNVGELRSIRVEHDGQGFGAGWFLEKIIITDSERPKDVYYFVYGGWIAKDEGEGKLWRDIKAKKSLPKEINEAARTKAGEKTKYQISVKTGDKRFAGTDANVFIQMCGAGNITPKVKLDDSKNNFERNTTDIFDIDTINVGPLKSITIGHDNFGPGAGWYLEKVEIRRYIPKAEALERLKNMKKRLKKEEREKLRRQKSMNKDEEDECEDEVYRESKTEKKRVKKDKKIEKEKKKPNFFSVSSESSSDSCDSDSSDDEEKKKGSSTGKRPGSAVSRTSQRSEDREGRRKEQHGRSASSERRPGSAVSRPGSGRKISTSLSGLEKQAIDRRLGRAKKEDDNDDDDDRVKELKVPLYEQYLFEGNCWLAKDEGDGKFVRELPVAKKTVYYKDR